MPTKNGYIAAGAVAAGLLLAGGLSAANAANTTSSSGTGYAYSAPGGQQGQPGGRQGGQSQDTPVTGTELDTVKAAVKAKDASITVNTVQKDPDGSYDVFGTKAGSRIMLEVSKDLKTITENQGRGGRGGGPGGQHTAVTGAEASKVGAAVKAKFSGITVTKVEKDADGSYDVEATKNGAQVRYDVSKDLATITERTGGPSHGGMRGGAAGEQSGTSPSQGSAPSQSATA